MCSGLSRSDNGGIEARKAEEDPIWTDMEYMCDHELVRQRRRVTDVFITELQLIDRAVIQLLHWEYFILQL